MAKRHVYLNNRKKQQDGFNRKRGFDKQKDKEEDNEVNPVIQQFQIANLRNYYNQYNQAYQNRYSKRTIEFPRYIDLIEIRFYTTFNKNLQSNFYSKYGLLPVLYSDFNKTVTFEVTEHTHFERFKVDIEHVISFDEDVSYSGEEYNLIALIYQFRFIDNRRKTTETNDLIISTIQSSLTETANLQFKNLMALIQSNQINYSLNIDEDIIYLKNPSNEVISTIADNFDIVQSITSSRTLKVRPGTYGTMHTEYGFNVDIPEQLPIVGVIDTGVNNLPPFEGLILEDGINITQESMADVNGHGTLVSGLAIFGSDLPSSIINSYVAKCRVFPIKALHNSDDGIDFPLLIDAIKTAKNKYGIRLFNMSLSFYHKKYNESYSEFAFELDKLAYELDILFFISVGNFDNIALRDLLTTDYHPDHDYPSFFYNPNSSSPTHSCETTNICAPSDSLNNISVGALAGNLMPKDNSDITPYNIYPAYYTRKFNFDYEQKINTQSLSKNQKNKHLNKPDFVFDGGDLQNPDSGVEVLSESDFFIRTTGTSLSTPLLTSIAAEILTTYPELHTQSVKALLINSAGYYTKKELPHFKDLNNDLLKKLIGFGIPNKQRSLFSNLNTITMVIEDQIKPLEILCIPIFLPEYLRLSGNKLIFNISLAYSFLPDKGNHLGYLPLHISFNLVRNVDVSAFNGNSEDYAIKKSMSWSEDHHGIDNRLFSNAQKKQYKLQPRDMENLDNQVAIAVRCLVKENIDESFKKFLESTNHPFSLVIEINEELKNDTGNVSIRRATYFQPISSVAFLPKTINYATFQRYDVSAYREVGA